MERLEAAGVEGHIAHLTPKFRPPSTLLADPHSRCKNDQMGPGQVVPRIEI